MDPQATLKLFLAAIEDKFYDEAIEHSCNYNAWIDRGGFKAILDGAEVLSLTMGCIYTSKGKVATSYTGE